MRRHSRPTASFLLAVAMHALVPACTGDSRPDVTADTADVPARDDASLDAFDAVDAESDAASDALNADAPRTVTDPDGGSWVCTPTYCGGHLAQCGDCLDGDGDGLVDSHDPDCLGPCWQNEGAAYLLGGVPEDANCGGRGCYFDIGTPTGPPCVYSLSCDPLEAGPTHWPEARCSYDAALVGTAVCPATQDERCHSGCGPLTPNGCDCFGCCTFPAIASRSAAEGGAFVWLASFDSTGSYSCTLDAVTDATRCHPCTPVRDCLNDCGPCEVCIGGALPDPARCAAANADGGTNSRCAAGVQPCGLAGESACPAGAYCITGCCQLSPP